MIMKTVLVLFLLAIVAFAETHYEEDLPEDWANLVQAKLYPAVKQPAFSEFPNWLYGDQ